MQAAAVVIFGRKTGDAGIVPARLANDTETEKGDKWHRNECSDSMFWTQMLS